jgi:hypothetical protein
MKAYIIPKWKAVGITEDLNKVESSMVHEFNNEEELHFFDEDVIIDPVNLANNGTPFGAFHQNNDLDKDKAKEWAKEGFYGFKKDEKIILVEVKNVQIK